MEPKAQILKSGLFSEAFYNDQGPFNGDPASDPIRQYLAEGAAYNLNPPPLFDSAHYHQQCGAEIPQSMSALEHYLSYGKRLSPHPLFDPGYYVLNSPKAASTSISLMMHYLASWRKERCSPHPLLDIDWYLEEHPDVLGTGLDPLSHFILLGAEAGYHPHPLFDTTYYYTQHPDVKAAGMNPLVHYVIAGGFEGRDPNPWFDSSYYLECNPYVRDARVNPLVHYVLTGAQERRAPHPLFRPDHWRATQGLESDGPGVLADFLAHARKPGTHSLAVLQLRQRRRFFPEKIDGIPGVNLIGWPRMEMGVAEQMRELARGLAAAGIDFSARDVSYMRPSDPGDDFLVTSIRQNCPHRVNLFAVNADNMTESCQRLTFEEVAQRFNIASWSWELSEFPDAWQNEFAVIDELWLYSTFMQQAISAKADVPVLHMPPAVSLPKPALLDRAHFGIPERKFVFLFLFDFSGYITRKNPGAAVAAFRAAFSSPSADVTLVIKTNNANRYPERLSQLQEAIGNDPRVVLIHETLRRDQVVSLLSHGDAFISLHRSEGFGRSLAESMLLGKPVIATNYSGNTDFMTAINSCPVNYSLVAVKPDEYPFGEGQLWADPDIEHASWYMRRLVANREYQEQIGAAAQDTLIRGYSPEATGRRMLRRLRILGLV